MPQRVRVVVYDPLWERLFREEAGRIRTILKDELADIHHIGSTAVPGLAAKPIIDIMPVVRDISRVDGYDGEFEKIGYECMGEFGISGRRYYRKGDDDRTHHVHIFETANRAEITRHLAVRDYLRSHWDEAERYGELKRELADRYPLDIEGYCDGKDAFVKALEATALAWYKEV